ncbi:MAG: sugar-binding domain-containing protein [Lawsonibacter sp.]|nr:sugar-binding domain-containing protein [Lawsonibacter sp.]
MAINREKQQKLAHVARRYYLEDWKQSDIANELGVSRPLVSRMLSEARELGVVEITVHEPGEQFDSLLDRLRLISSVRSGVLVEDGEDDRRTNQFLSQGAAELLDQLVARRLGVGWGHFVGQLVSWLEENPRPNSTVEDVCPLVGNAGFPIRNYHSNENVRLLAQQLGADPHFLYLPALPESLEEKQVLCSTELYRQIQQEWELMDTALVNIGNFPSTPDFASVARYGDLLQKHHACGRLLAYYFNSSGEIIQSDQDFAIQISIDILNRCPNVVGVCSANTSPRALRGALNTGRFTHLVARAELVRALFDEK